jgi:hypothetical protein
MDEVERLQLLALLDESRAAVQSAVAGVNEETARRTPGPGRWSILGCAEHIAFSERYMFAQIDIATTPDLPMINREREAKMMARGTDRSRRMESPPQGHPAGRFPTLAAAMAQFLASRERTIAFVRDCRQDLRAKLTWHPILKDCNCHEMLLSIGLHALRHAKQIEEIKTELP